MRIEEKHWLGVVVAPQAKAVAHQEHGSAGSELDQPIIGQSTKLLRALALARRVARSKLPVLLVGATGTGKELFAEQVHAWSRPGRPFVAVNCAAIPRELIEKELFGSRRGGFTGALENVAGLLEAAHLGTLFLDELLSLPLEAQAKLLRALDSGEFSRVGETLVRKADFRVVSAAQQDIAARVKRRGFRFDLLHRLAGIRIKLPSLAERGADLLTLGEYFAKELGRSLGPGAEAVLRGHSWPGNIRELRLAIGRAACLCSDSVIPAPVLAESIGLGAAFIDLEETSSRESVEPSGRERLLAVLAAHDWNAGRSARALGVGRTTLFKRLRALEISIYEERSALERRFVPYRPE